MAKTIKIAVTKSELAAIISALDYVLIDSTSEQFTGDSALLSDIYASLEAVDVDDTALDAFTKALTLRLSDSFKEAA
ncbi:hypothetical protein [Paenibacillus xylanexedens]|uniref:hypothetical protein n=1 Tax=Paenibacillus xylanexedens TaxID=528191 RepID=UPI0011A84EF9|nr:hypothetical protein [Paenibacillus xylanexedens]